MKMSVTGKFIGRAEKRAGDKINTVYLAESEYQHYTGCGLGIVILNHEGDIKKIKYLYSFSKIDDIKPFMRAVGKDYVVGMMSCYTVTRLRRQGGGLNCSGWTLKNITEYLEEEFIEQEKLG